MEAEIERRRKEEVLAQQTDEFNRWIQEINEMSEAIRDRRRKPNPEGFDSLNAHGGDSPLLREADEDLRLERERSVFGPSMRPLREKEPLTTLEFSSPRTWE